MNKLICLLASILMLAGCGAECPELISGTFAGRIGRRPDGDPNCHMSPFDIVVNGNLLSSVCGGPATLREIGCGVYSAKTVCGPSGESIVVYFTLYPTEKTYEGTVEFTIDSHHCVMDFVGFENVD